MKINNAIRRNYLSILFFIILLVIICGGILASRSVSADKGYTIDPQVQIQKEEVIFAVAIRG